jgi:hypothetical protein
VGPGVVVATGLAAGAFAGQFAYDGPSDAGPARIAAALAVVLASLLVAEVRPRLLSAPIAGPLVWAAAWGALAAVATVTVPGRWSLLIVACLGVAAATLVFALERAHAALAAWSGDEAASLAVCAFIVPATAAPLWLGPLALRSEVGDAATAAALWVGPLGYLAAASGVDIVRATWLYAQSPLGGVRYDYPDPLLYAAVLAALGAAFWLIASRKAVRPVR